MPAGTLHRNFLRRCSKCYKCFEWNPLIPNFLAISSIRISAAANKKQNRKEIGAPGYTNQGEAETGPTTSKDSHSLMQT